MKKNIIIASSFIVLLVLANVFFYNIRYYVDLARSQAYDLFDSNSHNKIFSHKAIIPQYQKTYSWMPKGFLRIGSMVIYTAAKRTSLNSLASYAIAYTDFFTISRFAASIRRVNELSSGKITLMKDECILLPDTFPTYISNSMNTKKPDLIYVRGLYFTGTSAGRESIVRKLPLYKSLGINAIVFDVKDITGIVNYYSNVPEVARYNTHEKRTIDNIRKLIRDLKKHGIYSIARLSLFHDHLMARANPGFTIRSKRTGGMWNRGSKEVWCDPSNKTIQDYNIKIALELADYGVDEIQFDYIRFPTMGDLNDAKFSHDFGIMKKEEVIAHFLQRAYTKLQKKNVNVSIDIFGVVAWGKEIDIEKTGQRIELLAKYCDAISPMLYPSHFNNDFDGYAYPGDNPYYFIYKGCEKVLNLSQKKVAVRPWLQAFGWRVSNYNEKYILDQVKASDHSGAKGFLFWNASNEYGVVYRAMKSIKNVKSVAVKKNKKIEDNNQRDDIGG